jgi:hypothetical protein
MIPPERELLAFLCKLIAEEKDPNTFDRLVTELNELLGVKRARIHPELLRSSAPEFTPKHKTEQ